jgi:hypothetical protein
MAVLNQFSVHLLIGVWLSNNNRCVSFYSSYVDACLIGIQFCLEYCGSLPKAEEKLLPCALTLHTSPSTFIYLGDISIPGSFLSGWNPSFHSIPSGNLTDMSRYHSLRSGFPLITTLRYVNSCFGLNPATPHSVGGVRWETQLQLFASVCPIRQAILCLLLSSALLVLNLTLGHHTVATGGVMWLWVLETTVYTQYIVFGFSRQVSPNVPLHARKAL